MEELVSIVVLSYNSQFTIERTLDSIINQTYNNIEIIISDDCSTDSTIDVVKKWYNHTSFSGGFLILTSKHNTGVTANVNRGVKAANGAVLKILAADDTLEKNAISIYMKYYKVYGKNVICQSKVNLIDENDALLNGNGEISVSSLESAYSKLSESNQLHNLLKGNFIVAPAVGLISKSIIIRYGYFDERFPMMEDYPFYLKMACNGITFKLIHFKLVNYRISSKSISHAKRSKAKDKYMLSYANFVLLVKFVLLIKNRMFFTAIVSFIQSLKHYLICLCHKTIDFFQYKQK